MSDIAKVKQVIVMRLRYPDGNGGTRKVRLGKYCAQAAHASMAWLSAELQPPDNSFRLETDFNHNPWPIPVPNGWRGIDLTEEEQAWIEGKFTKICLGVDSEEELLEVYQKAKDAGLTVHLITDCGDTEFGGEPTHTALAIGPHSSDKIDPITRHLKLL